VPGDWEKYFEAEYLKNIKFYCLVMSEKYIENHYNDIKKYSNVIENRLFDDELTKESIIADNKNYKDMCISHGLPYVLIDENYNVQIEL